MRDAINNETKAMGFLSIHYLSWMLTVVGDKQAARYKKLRCREARLKAHRGIFASGCRTLVSLMYETHMKRKPGVISGFLC